MKISEAWLREWVNPQAETVDLVAQLTMAGLEIDGVEPVATEEISGVIVGEIVSIERHPDAEKLNVCQVKGHSDGIMQVVCGAANARKGIRIPFATVGAQLPNGVTIKKAKLRGIESFGMLCSQDELGLGVGASGLWELQEDANVGESLNTYLKLNDRIIEVDLTPNRGDCLSVRGMAREIGALYSIDVVEPTIEPVTPALENTFPINVEAKSECPVYVGRVIRNINIHKSSPIWLTEKLRRSGIRSIDPVVDITNYVMLELGQPMHAFDLDKLEGSIVVRTAHENEKFVALNEQEIVLRKGALVIADENNVLALAGIIGGSNTAVSESTRNIFLESAFFSTISVAGKARSYGLHTDSSHRFERGVDPRIQRLAIERATQLILEIVGGEAGPVSVVEQKEALNDKVIRLNHQRLESGLSLQKDQVDVINLLGRLGLKLVKQDELGWDFLVPSHRFDLSIEEDLLEEVARIYGYDHLPTRPLLLETNLRNISETDTPLSNVKKHLVSRGYQEAITYSFISPDFHKLFYPDENPIALKNPISEDMSSMRTSLLPGLTKTLIQNLNRHHESVRLFESGMVFKGEDTKNLSQHNRIAAIVYGPVQPINWSEASNDVDFFDLKGDLESLLDMSLGTREQIRFEPFVDSCLFHPGQTAHVCLGENRIGVIGALHPTILKELGLAKSVYMFELELDPVLTSILPKFRGISRFPQVSRDLAIVVPQYRLAQDVEACIKEAGGDLLKQSTLFDVYSGEGVGADSKSMAFSLVFQNTERTLNDDDINQAMTSILQALENNLGAKLR